MIRRLLGFMPAIVALGLIAILVGDLVSGRLVEALRNYRPTSLYQWTMPWVHFAVVFALIYASLRLAAKNLRLP